jgi:antitoxin HigA-1
MGTSSLLEGFQVDKSFFSVTLFLCHSRAKRRIPVFLPLGIGQVAAARRLGISLNRLNEIVLGKRAITADTALRLARFLKTSPQFWMRLQADWDLRKAMALQARKAY